jgi:outer membrane protein
MFKKYLSVISLATLGLFALVGSENTARAQALKVGYTDHEMIIAAMPDYANIQSQLQTEYNGAQEALQSLAQDFQSEVEKYQKQQPLLSAERRAEREQELQKQQQDLQEAAGRKDEDLAKLEADLMQPIFDRVQTAIDEVAASHGLDIVLRHRVGNQPVILYVNPDTVLDISIEVAEKLGIDVEAAQAAADTPSN